MVLLKGVLDVFDWRMGRRSDPDGVDERASIP